MTVQEPGPVEVPGRHCGGVLVRPGQQVAALLADVTLACAACDLPKAAGDTDTAAFEIALLERAFGASLPALLRLVGVQNLQGRADLDTLVSHLVGLGL